MLNPYNGARGDADGVPLQHWNNRRDSLDSTGSLDFDRFLSEDVSEASSTDQQPVDGGREAWMCLLGCWLVEAMIWGFPLAFGVFESYYERHPLFKDSNNIPTIGTLATGVAYLGMPITNPIAAKWSEYRRLMCASGLLLSLFGLVAASFATTMWQLVLFQGFLYGAGWVIAYTPFLFILNEWFVEKLGLCYGILFGASGVSGLIIPSAVGWMLRRFDFRIALRVYALLTFVVAGSGWLMIKPRRQVTSGVAGLPAKPTKSALGQLRRMMNSIHFWILVPTVFVQGLGFFIPNIYITVFAEDLGYSNTVSLVLLSLVSLSQVIGQLGQGWISDRVNIYIPVSLSALLPALATLFLWGPAKSIAPLAAFALIWGLFSSSYSVLYTRISTFLTQSEHDEGKGGSDSAMMLIYGLVSFERGISCVLEGPISSWLIGPKSDDVVVNVDRYGLGLYAGVIWFTVVCMLLSSICGIGWLWRRKGQ